MAFCRVVFPLLVLSVISCFASRVPVYLWSDSLKSSVKAYPLNTYFTEEFSGLLKSLQVDEPMFIVFLEKSLSVEDFSQKNADGETLFPYLHDKIDEAIYLPSVEDAVLTLNQSSFGMGSDNVVLTENRLIPEIAVGSSSKGRFLFINLNDAREGETRAEMLSRHDAFMQKTIEENMPEDMKVIGIYTAEDPSWTIPEAKSRFRRAAETASQIYTLDELLFDVDSINLISGNDTRTLNSITAQSSKYDDNTVNATLTFDTTSLLLTFYKQAGYWFFDTVVLTVGSVTETLFPAEPVYALLDFSYRCAHHVRFSSQNQSISYTISFDNLQVQPFLGTANETQKFGESFNCVGFFSAPIWAGLFVVAILLSITFYGIMMMLDIRTMDRFDDPKGKTITINATE